MQAARCSIRDGGEGRGPEATAWSLLGLEPAQGLRESTSRDSLREEEFLKGILGFAHPCLRSR